MLPEWVYWIVITVLIIVICVNLYKYYYLKEYKNMVKSYDEGIDSLHTTINKYRRLYWDSMEENKQLKLYLYQNISDYYKRNPDKKN